MRAVKILVTLAVIYVGVVVTFESLLGYFQPADANTMVITTFDGEGQGADRVVARLQVMASFMLRRTTGLAPGIARPWPTRMCRLPLTERRLPTGLFC